MTRRTFTHSSPLAVALTLALAACDSSPTEPGPDPTPAEVNVTPAEVTLTEIGATEQLSAVVLDEDGEEIEGAEVTWSSSDESVATVTEDGEVEAVGEGTATITATSGEVEGTAEITVVESDPTPAEVTVSPAEVTLTEIGATEQLSAAVLDEDGEEIEGAEVTWSSSDESVATVTEDGEVEAVGEGTATITAMSGEVEGTAEVTVELDVE